MLLPSSIGDIASKMQKAIDQAHIDTLGALEKVGITESEKEQIAKRTDQLLTEQIAKQNKLKQSPDWDDAVLDSHKSGLVPAQVIQHNPTSWRSLNAMLQAYVTGSWTTIETLFGDLWETSLNNCPNPLANLDGKPKRMKTKNSDQNQTSKVKESKVVELDLIKDHNFNVQHKMGTILKSRFSFSRLEGIREAYSSAFDRDFVQIDKALTDQSLDTLNAVRNLIIHRDAFADDEYIKRSRSLRLLPKAELGNEIELDGDVVVSLLKPAFAAANQLLVHVDAWLTKHRPRS